MKKVEVVTGVTEYPELTPEMEEELSNGKEEGKQDAQFIDEFNYIGRCE